MRTGRGLEFSRPVIFAVTRFFAYVEDVGEAVAAWLLEGFLGVPAVLRGDLEVVSPVGQCRDDEGEARRFVAQDGGGGHLCFRCVIVRDEEETDGFFLVARDLDAAARAVEASAGGDEFVDAAGGDVGDGRDGGQGFFGARYDDVDFFQILAVFGERGTADDDAVLVGRELGFRPDERPFDAERVGREAEFDGRGVEEFFTGDFAQVAVGVFEFGGCEFALRFRQLAKVLDGAACLVDDVAGVVVFACGQFVCD